MDLERRIQTSQKPWKMLSITFAAVLAVSVFVKLLGPVTTGYIIAPVDRADIGEMAYRGSEYIFSSQNLTVKSLKISGKIIGNGSVNVYLAGKDKKLVYSNNPEKSIPLITGFAVSQPSQSTTLKANLDEIRIQEKKTLSDIRLKYSGGQEGMYLEKMRITIEPDNGEKILGVLLNNVEFWGYNKAGTPLGPAPSGTMLYGWGQKFPKDITRAINAIEFDSDITDKKVVIELSYNEYLPGFRLGDERTLKMGLDLTGKTLSYIEESGGGRNTIVLKPDERPSVPEVPAIVPPPEKTPVVNPEDYPGFKAEARSDGKIEKTKGLNIAENAITFQVIEDPEAKAIFDSSPHDMEETVEHACVQTCVLDAVQQESYSLLFEIDDGTAFNVDSVEFS